MPVSPWIALSVFFIVTSFDVQGWLESQNLSPVGGHESNQGKSFSSNSRGFALN
jgi:hypothetical protein